MNRKHLLILTLFVLQSYSSLYSSNQDTWNKIFTVLGATTYENAAPDRSVSEALGKDLAATSEGKIAIKYVGNGQGKINSNDATTFTTALATFKNGGSVAGAQIGDAVAANWTAAIAAFGTAQQVYDKVTTLTRSVPTSLANASAAVKADAQVVVQYLTGATMNATDLANLQAAFTAANVNKGSSSTATDTAAAQLKAQIEAAKEVYNKYKPGTYTATA
ncbi:hypothetical protein KBC04_04735 [Candidatus Babeliales bacterium]|nr:hypothetical protein [Candidatus Babeliales bacterium]MBP9844126.1 hypothetical protein [Candidatus Babeliales bacterium]